MLERLALNPGRWATTASTLVAIAACGGRVSSSGGSSGVSSDHISTGTMSGSGTVSGVASGTTSGTLASPEASITEASTEEASSAEASTVDAAEAGAQSAEPGCAPGGPGLTDCGSAKESCCASLAVSGGTFYRTYDLDPFGGGANWAVPEGGATGLADPATITTFRLDKYDVTVGRFRQFVRAVLPPGGGPGWMPATGSGKHVHLNGGQGLVDIGATADGGTAYEIGWNPADNTGIAPTDTNLACDPMGHPHYATWTAAVGSQENLPINCATWQEAYAFCIWDGGFLPSEAEWEYAAAGGNEQRTYPWGSADPGTASLYAIYGCYHPSGPPGFMCSGVSNVAAVGSLPAGAGAFGHLDLAGGMYQWNLDWYANYANPCADCANLTGVLGRVVRGGDFLEDEATLLPPVRNSLNDPTTSRDFGIGFRCARSP
jgi:formylglycine-generating enzyme required for sulfatase activity